MRSSLASRAGVGLAVAVAAALWDTGFHVVPTAQGTWRAVSDPPGALRLVSAIVLGGLVAWATRRSSPAVRRALLPLALLAAPLVPVATGRVLPLLALQGPVRVLLLAAVVALVACRLLADRVDSQESVPDLLLFVAALSFFGLLGTRIPGAAGPQGDEPQYLVMAQSLLSDGDLDLTDEFANQEYSRFYSGPLQPHRSLASPPDRTYSFHLPGLAALVLPAYALGGYPGVRLFLSMLVALAAVLVHRLVRDALHDSTLALAAWAVFVFTPPVPFYALQLYPETPVLLAMAVFMLAARTRPGWAWVAASALAASVLPWLHTKFLPLGALGLFLTLARPCSWRMRAAATAVFAASVALLLAFFHRCYGTASLSAAYGSPDWSAGRLPWGVAGLFLDRQWGVLAISPVWALLLPGLVLLWRWRPGDTMRALLLAGPPLAAGAGHAAWWGGACPPGRFVLVSLPPLVLALAAAMKARPALAAVLGGIGVGVVGLAADAPRILHNRFDGESLLLRFLSPAVDLNALLPSFFDSGWPVVVLALSLAAAFMLAWRWRRWGLLAGVVAFWLVALGLRERPLVDERLAGQRVLLEWQPERWRAFSGAPDLRALSLPVELPRRPWILRGTELRASRMMDLPPGSYFVDVRLRPLEPAPASVRLEMYAGPLVLAAFEGPVRNSTAPVTMSMVLPVGARHLALSASALLGTAELEDARLRPQSVVPRDLRDGLPWPLFAEPDRYRLQTGTVAVTLLDRTAREGAGFRLYGDEGAFVLDGRPGSPVEMRVRRLRADPEDGVFWGTRRIALGSDLDTVLPLRLEDGVELGAVAVLPVRVRAREAWVAFAP